MTTTAGKQMHGVFVRVETEKEVSTNKELSKKLTEVCPVDIFALNPDGTGKIREENQDECVLCELCIRAAPEGKVRVIKVYDNNQLLKNTIAQS